MTNILKLNFVVAFLMLTSCASSTYKARQEQREKISASTGMFCDWVNGDKHSDIEVELNLQMAKRCDSNKTFSLTNYKNNSDQNGVLYCCSMTSRAEYPVITPPIKKSTSSAPSKSTPAANASDDIVEDK